MHAPSPCSSLPSNLPLKRRRAAGAAFTIILIAAGAAALVWRILQPSDVAGIAQIFSGSIPADAVELPAVRTAFSHWEKFGATGFLKHNGFNGLSAKIDESGREMLKTAAVPKGWLIDLPSVRRGTFPLRIETPESSPDKTVRIVTGPQGVHFYNIGVFPVTARRYFLTVTARGSGSIAGGAAIFTSTAQDGSPRPLTRLGKRMAPQRLTAMPNTAADNAPWQTFTTVLDLFPPQNGVNIHDWHWLLFVQGDITLRSVAAYAVAEDPGSAVVEGTITARSALPAPETTNYPDCHYTAEFHGAAILSGAPLPQKVKLVIPGFVQKRLTSFAALPAGQKLKLRLVPFDSLPEKTRSGQQADDLASFDLESYWVADAAPLKFFSECVSSNGQTIDFTQLADYRSPFLHAVNPPLSPKITAEQTAAINRERETAAALSARYAAAKKAATDAGTTLSASFTAAWTENQKRYSRIKSESDIPYIWANLAVSPEAAFCALPPTYTLPEVNLAETQIPQTAAGGRQGLLTFRDFLAAQNVQLIAVPVPDQQAIAARLLNPEFAGLPDAETLSAVRWLTENNIETIYIADELLRRAREFPALFCYPHDGHPHDGTQIAAAALVGERLKRFAADIEAAARAAEIRTELFSVRYDRLTGRSINLPAGGDLGKYRSGEVLPYRHVLYEGREIPNPSASPILVIGNSFAWTPCQPDYPSFPAALASSLHFFPRYWLMASDGPCSTIPTLMFNHPEKYLQGTKAVILYLAARYFSAAAAFVDLRALDAKRRGL